jgi:cell division protein FtsZ
MVMPGLINLDFADIRAVMSEMGKAMMGTGEATGDNRAVAAAEAAISNPLLEDITMKGAKGVLINITGGLDMTLFEVDEAANRIRDEVDPEANIIFGSTFDQSLDGKVRISVVATGIDAQAQAQPRPGYGNLSLVARGVPQQPAADMGDRPAAVGSYNQGGGFAQGGMGAPAAATMAAPQMRPTAMSGMAQAAMRVAQPMAQMSAQPTAQMMPQTIGNTALQAQPTRQVLVDEMAALDRLVSRPVERVERQIDDRPFVAPPAAEPAQRVQATIAEPVVQQPVAQAPAMREPTLSAPAPQVPAQQPPALTVDAPHVERRRAPSLFEKVTSKLTGQSLPGQSAQQRPAAPAPQPAAPTQRKVEPQALQPQLQLDPADRMSISRAEEDMLDIPAFLRRQAN